MSRQRDEMDQHDKAANGGHKNAAKERAKAKESAKECADGDGRCESLGQPDGAQTLKPWSLMARIVSLPVYFYRYLISPLIPPRCRFQPTCSEFALTALQRHGALKGGWLALRRIGKCHPWGGSGFDPVPENSNCDHNHQKPHKQVDKQG